MVNFCCWILLIVDDVFHAMPAHEEYFLISFAKSSCEGYCIPFAICKMPEKIDT